MSEPTSTNHSASPFLGQKESLSRMLDLLSAISLEPIGSRRLDDLKKDLAALLPCDSELLDQLLMQYLQIPNAEVARRAMRALEVCFDTLPQPIRALNVASRHSNPAFRFRALRLSQLSEKDAEVAKREAAVKDQQAAVAKARESVDEEVAAKLKTERAAIAAEELKKAKTLLGTDLDQRNQELADLQLVLKQRDEKLAEAQKAQAELIRKQRELDDAKREMDLTIEKKVQESLGAVRDKAKQEAEDGLKLKVAEKEEQIAGMQRQIEELKRKAEQGSQQLQGEVLELELETAVRSAFPTDSVEPVPKGEFGGDLIHRVFNTVGQPCGAILWESKRTKNWSDGWLAKLRGDQRAANAEIALIVSQVLPKDCDSFSFIDGVWVTSHRCAIPVAIALRHSLIELAAARQAGEGQQTKMELVYQYLTGPRFRHRIQAIVEKFSDMHEDLQKERKAMTKQWSKREEQIRCVIESTAGMYGDLQGIAGKTLLEIEGLAMPLLDGVPPSDPSTSST